MPQTALVTGAAQNIGKGIAKHFLAQGIDCVLVDKNKAGLQATAASFSKLSGKSWTSVLDISDSKQIDKLLDWLGQQKISVNVLVNNAGYESNSAVKDLTVEEMEHSYRTNLIGPFYLTTQLTKQWVTNNEAANVVFISSVHGKVIRTHPLYSSSKAAIEMFVKEAALEFAPHNIRINAVAPGPVRDTQEPVADYRTPMGQVLEPQDIAAGVDFLISLKARFITGETLTIDGGYGITHTHHWIKGGHLPRPPQTGLQ